MFKSVSPFTFVSILFGGSHHTSAFLLIVVNVEIFSLSMFKSVSPFTFVSILIGGSHHTSAFLLIVAPLPLVHTSIFVVHPSPSAPLAHVPPSLVVALLIVHRPFAMFLSVFPVTGVNFLVLAVHLINQYTQVPDPILFATLPAPLVQVAARCPFLRSLAMFPVVQPFASVLVAIHIVHCVSQPALISFVIPFLPQWFVQLRLLQSWHLTFKFK